MKYLTMLVLAIFTACSTVPFVEKEAEEIIEFEVEEYMVLKWYEEETEEAKEFREKFLDPYVLRIRPKKWPWGMC